MALHEYREAIKSKYEENLASTFSDMSKTGLRIWVRKGHVKQVVSYVKFPQTATIQKQTQTKSRF